MIVTFISQCDKKAIKRTRQVLDTFANRIGDFAWQTVITADGLAMVKKLLTKNVSKNTAVSCYRFHSRKHSELLWIIGNRNKFNEMGFVPVNTTQKDVRVWQDGHLWQNLELIALAASIAGLFHDFGKANDLFQQKLNPNIKSKNYEPYRHEWVSLKLFEGFVQNQHHEVWLKQLANPEKITQNKLIDYAQNTQHQTNFNNQQSQVQFQNFTDFTKLVAWLIVSHHRLLAYPYFQDYQPILSDLNEKRIYQEIDVKWNSPNYLKKWTDDILQNNWQFSFGLPIQSEQWQKQAQKIALQALNNLSKINDFQWKNDILTVHLSRAMLMFADHYYSAQDANPYFQDKHYQAYANTNQFHQYKQKLDEHNLQVGHYAYHFSRKLPLLLSELATIGFNRTLEKGIQDKKSNLSEWQNKAVKLANKINIRANECGFFGLNMASTGKGKTLANARIMYALSDKEKGLRLNITLGLRTLTSQTGNALKSLLQLDDNEIAVLIGSTAIQQLLEKNSPSSTAQDNQLLNQQKQLLEDLERTHLAYRGSESLQDDDFDIEYNSQLTLDENAKLLTWFKNKPKYQKLLYAPILVSTIDHLMPATESLRGGKQIAPMLRLLSSDLVLDEPDEFSVDDWFALTRLVNWAGMLGSKVLLSSATIPPAMAFTLFQAYKQGRQIYNQSMTGNQQEKPIICAWFDEFSVQDAEISTDYLKYHQKFIKNRIRQLNSSPQHTHKAKIIPIIDSHHDIINNFAETVFQAILQAHQHHHQINHHGIQISLGVVRFANINPLVNVAISLIQKNAPDNYCIHYCVYHSQFTLAIRSMIEERLDRILNRKNPENIWQQPEIKQAIHNSPNAKHHIFVVLATSVCEVGRDHDYDWAIAEPSSMRSLIQLSGRVQRHRKQCVTSENIFILNQNIKSLKGKQIAFCRPGFESKFYSINKQSGHQLNQILNSNQYQLINAIPAIDIIKFKSPPYDNLVELEHSVHWAYLTGRLNEKNNASIWLNQPITWIGEAQRQQPFRRSSQQIELTLQYNQKGKLAWHECKANDNTTFTESSLVHAIDISCGQNIKLWFENNDEICYNDLSLSLNKPIAFIQKTYGKIQVINYGHQWDLKLYYHSFLGMFTKLDDEQ